jgi:hypothetical protein
MFTAEHYLNKAIEYSKLLETANGPKAGISKAGNASFVVNGAAPRATLGPDRRHYEIGYRKPTRSEGALGGSQAAKQRFLSPPCGGAILPPQPASAVSYRSNVLDYPSVNGHLSAQISDRLNKMG